MTILQFAQQLLTALLWPCHACRGMLTVHLGAGDDATRLGVCDQAHTLSARSEAGEPLRKCGVRDGSDASSGCHARARRSGRAAATCAPGRSPMRGLSGQIPLCDAFDERVIAELLGGVYGRRLGHARELMRVRWIGHEGPHLAIGGEHTLDGARLRLGTPDVELLRRNAVRRLGTPW
jgi:hypothetical protein